MREDLETKYSRIGDFCKKEKKQFWQKISARIPHSVCLKVGNVDRIAIWSGSLGLTRARSVCWCLELISVSFQPYDLEP